MSRNISDMVLQKLSDLISSRMGLHFPSSRWDDLRRGILSAAKEFGFADTDRFIDWLSGAEFTREHVEKLARNLTVGETYFFRDGESFKALESHVLPELVRAKRNEKRLRIWSAGCSSGEEPYSIAMMLTKLIPDLSDWNITILATDINPQSLKKAFEGRYTEWSFRGIQPWIKDQYFIKDADGIYEILPSIKKMVIFEYLNLADDVYPSLVNNTNGMDMVFCRNVLMYFSSEHARKVVRGFYNSLVDGGWLLLSPTEYIKSLSSQFVTVNFVDATLYRKDTKRQMQEQSPQHPAFVATHEPAFPLWMPPAVPYVPPGAPLPAPPSMRAANPVQNAEEPDPYQEALLAFEQGFYGRSIEILTALAATGKDTPRVATLLARCNANLGKLEDAHTWCARAIEADQLDPFSHYLLATILQEEGSLDEAVKSLNRALYLDHDFILAYFVLGNIMQRLGNSKASMKSLKNASGLLSSCKPDDVLPQSDGLTAGRLFEIIESMTH